MFRYHLAMFSLGQSLLSLGFLCWPLCSIGLGSMFSHFVRVISLAEDWAGHRLYWGLAPDPNHFVSSHFVALSL